MPSASSTSNKLNFNRSGQARFHGGAFQFSDKFGGDARTSRRSRGFRPLNSKDHVHVVIKSLKAVGRQSFRHPLKHGLILKRLHELSKRWGVVIHQQAVEKNHVHLLIKITSRHTYVRWIRALTSAWSAILCEGVKKGFWPYRPFTRVVRGLKGLIIAKNYVKLNEQEALGEIPYKPLRTRGLSPPEWLLIAESG